MFVKYFLIRKSFWKCWFESNFPFIFSLYINCSILLWCSTFGNSSGVLLVFFKYNEIYSSDFLLRWSVAWRSLGCQLFFAFLERFLICPIIIFLFSVEPMVFKTNLHSAINMLRMFSLFICKINNPVAV